MSYVAIARKYRPTTFDEIVGQEHVTRTLRNAIERDRVHHAYLFCGARGVGKTTAARALARALNCREGPTATPCGSCPSCTAVAAGNSPDLVEIDGASNNSVDDVRELRESVHYAPTHGQWKIYLVDEVHMLSKGAFNALLKTLEEPPPQVAFIFATTEPHRIPDTILSRVQRFDFKRIGVSAVAERLRSIASQEGASLSEASLRLIARAGEGSMRDAQSLLDQVIAFAGPEISEEEVVQTLGLIDRSLLYEMLAGLVGGEPARCLQVIDTVHGYGYELGQFTAELLEAVRNATFLRLSPEARRYVDLPQAELAQLEQTVDAVPAEALTRLFDALVELQDAISRASRPRITLEMAVARLATLRPLQPVAALVDRMDQVQRELRHRGGPPPRGGLRSRRSPGRDLRAPPPADARPSAAPARPAAPASSSTSPPASPPPEANRPPPTADPASAAPPEPEPESPEEGLGAWWPHIQALLRAQGKAGARAAQAEPQMKAGGLLLLVSSQRRKVEAKRLLDREEVASGLRDLLGDTPVHVVFSTQDGAPSGDLLTQQVKGDPRFRRILETFDVQEFSVRPLREED